LEKFFKHRINLKYRISVAVGANDKRQTVGETISGLENMLIGPFPFEPFDFNFDKPHFGLDNN